VGDRPLAVAVALVVAIPIIGILPLIPDSSSPSPVTLSGTFTLDDPQAANISSILANRVSFSWSISTVQPYRENTYEPIGFLVRATAGTGVKNVSMGTVNVLLYDTAEGRPRLTFTDLGVARYSAPLTWTDFGDDYELVSSAGTAPYYLAIWPVGTIFYADGHYLLFGDPTRDLRRVSVHPAYGSPDAGIVVAADAGAFLLLIGALLTRKRRSPRPPQGTEITPPPAAPP